MTHSDPTLGVERQLADSGADFVLGIDEVGRGCLAGPVVLGVAAVSRDRLMRGIEPVEGIRDSKQLTEHRREELLPQAQRWCDAWAVGAATNEEIDELGIVRCLGLAAMRGIVQVERQLGVPGVDPVDPVWEGIGPMDAAAAMPGMDETLAGAGSAGGSGAVPALARFEAILDGPNDYITPVMDGMADRASLALPHVTTRVKADATCAVVSTASVIAKVLRDHYMVMLADRHPEWEAYGWKRNKGYGTAAHRAAIRDGGATPYHRLSWRLV